MSESRRKRTCDTLKLDFGRWSDAVIDAVLSNDIRAEVALHFLLCSCCCLIALTYGETVKNASHLPPLDFTEFE